MTNLKTLAAAAILAVTSASAAAALDRQTCRYAADAIEFASELRLGGSSYSEIYSGVMRNNPSTDAELLLEILEVAFNPELFYLTPRKLGEAFYEVCKLS